VSQKSHQKSQEKKMIKKKSKHDVTTTLNRLENILQEKGIGIVVRVDHVAAAKNVDMELWFI